MNLPEHLDETGRTLWADVLAENELGPAEMALLAVTCAQADTVARLEDEWRRQDYPTEARGSMGQIVAHPLVSELRQHRNALRQLLAGLRLADPDEISVSLTGRMSRTESARKAASVRWSRRGTT